MSSVRRGSRFRSASKQVIKNLNEAKEKHGANHNFIEVDIDKDNTGLAAKFGVKSVPTTVVVKENKDFQSKAGALAYGDLEKLIKG